MQLALFCICMFILYIPGMGFSMCIEGSRALSSTAWNCSIHGAVSPAPGQCPGCSPPGWFPHLHGGGNLAGGHTASRGDLHSLLCPAGAVVCFLPQAWPAEMRKAHTKPSSSEMRGTAGWEVGIKLCGFNGGAVLPEDV